MFPSYTVHFLPYCTTFCSYCRCDPPGTEHFLYSYSRCDISDTADFLITQHTMSFCYRCKLFIVCTFSSHLAQPSPRTSDVILLVLHTFSICTADVTLLILQIFSSKSTPCLPAEHVAFWCCSLSSHAAQPYPHNRQPSPHTADTTLLVLQM